MSGWGRLRSWFASARESELDEELGSHVQLRADDLERTGLTRAEAERRARVEFGGYVKYKEQGREASGGQFFATLMQDVRLSLRGLRKSPGFAFAAVATLALAIGANAVVFGVMNALIIRPLDVPHPESLFAIERGPDKAANQSYLDYIDIRDRNRSFDSLALYSIISVGLDTGNNPTQSWGYEVSGNYFDMLGIQPYIGRFFHAGDEHGPNAAPYIVLSYDYWHNTFHDDRNVVGRVVQLNKHPFTILGVAPQAFQGTLLFFFPEIWVPLVNHEQVWGSDVLNARANRNFIMMLGHLKGGVSKAQAIADLNSVGLYLEKTYPKEDAKMSFALAQPSLAGDLLGPAVKAFVSGLMVLSGLILLAACANLGSLFAARAADRSREVALRLALGSSRRRILRGVFTEALLISLAGGAVGLLGSVVLLRELSMWRPVPSFPTLHVPVEPDGNVYLVALLLALVSGFLFSIVPVRQVLRTNPYEVVKTGGTGILAGNTGRRVTVRDVMLVVQIAICAVLVTSSLVAVRGLVRSMHSSFGFDSQHVMTVDTRLAMAGYSGDRVPAMQKRMIEAVETIPGAKAVGIADHLPLSGAFGSANVYSDQTTDFKPATVAVDSYLFEISPDYLSAAGTVMLAGRSFTWHDDKSSPRVAIVNPQFASKLYGSERNAVGKYFKLGDGTRVEVVGVTEQGKYYQLTEEVQEAMFFPLLQRSSSETTLVVRSDRDPEQLAKDIRGKLRGLDEGLPLTVATWAEVQGIALFPSRVATVALGAMGAMGAMLAITGIFGMAAYSVSKRMRELGIRVALGAQRWEVLQSALGRPLKLLAFGSALGLVLGLLATKVLAYIVYQADPRDPLVLGGVVFAMLLLGMLATWLPARRALSVNPLSLLREE